MNFRPHKTTAAATASALMAGALSIALLAAPVASASSQSPAQVLQSALHNATSQGSVHVSESSQYGTRTAVLTSDVGANAGTQLLKIANVGSAHVLVVGNTAYLSGSPGVLTEYYGIPKKTAQAIGSRWVSVPSSSSSFTTIASGATLASLLKSFTPSATLAQHTVTAKSGPVITISGKPSAKVKGSSLVTLYLTNSSSPLPTAGATIGGATSSTAEFTNWGEKVSVAAPSKSVPLSSIK